MSQISLAMISFFYGLFQLLQPKVKAMDFTTKFLMRVKLTKVSEKETVKTLSKHLIISFIANQIILRE